MVAAAERSWVVGSFDCGAAQAVLRCSYLDLISVDFRRCGFRLGVLFCRAVMKIGMTQNISPSFTSSHSTSSGDASPTTVRSASRKVGRLRRADMAANWSDIATRKYFLSGGPPPMCSTSCAVIFQTLVIRLYAPFGMLGKPKSAVIIKGAHYRLWVSLYLVGGSLTSWAGNPFEPQFPSFWRNSV